MLETSRNICSRWSVRISLACVVVASAMSGCSGASDTGDFGGAQSGESAGSGSGSSSGHGAGGDDASTAGDDATSSSGASSGSSSGHPSSGSSSGSGSSGTSSGSKDGGTSPKDASTTGDSSSSGGGSDASSGFDQFQQHNLQVVNMYRAMVGSAPLTLDAQLCTFALAGSTELSQDHMPHQHFITISQTMNGTGLFTGGYGFMMSAGENQGDPNGWTVLDKTDPVQNELDQIDAIQLAMWNEGPGTGEAHGHYENIINTKFKRLGVGLLEVNNKLYLTNDFSD
jgi:uncharacterized protein YkwD